MHADVYVYMYVAPGVINNLAPRTETHTLQFQGSGRLPRA